MSRCIVHIGMHKTGTTSIQASLRGYADDEFVYADLGKDPNHSLAMYSLFAPEPKRHPLLQQIHGGNAAAISSYIAATRRRLDKALSAAGNRTLIISGEDICNIPAAGLLELRDYFKARSRPILIAGYVRPPAALMTSRFQQRIKEGSVQAFDLGREYKSYKPIFSKFDKVFGRNRVRLWKYDPELFPEKCVVRDFCVRLRVDFRGPVVRLNDSLPRPAVVLLHVYRKMSPQLGFKPMTSGEGQRIGDLLAAIGDEKFRISPDAIEPVLLENRPDIRWMEARLGKRLDEDLGAHQPGDVLEETDLLDPGRRTIDRLLELLGKSAPRGVRGNTPEEVARIVHAFREKNGGWLKRYFSSSRNL